MTLNVGPKSSVPVSGKVLVPEKRPGERTVVVDVISVAAAASDVGRAYFRAGFQPAGDREVMFKFRIPKAVNLRPAAMYSWRLEIPVLAKQLPKTLPDGAVLVKIGQEIPGSAPSEIAAEDLLVFRGRFPMLLQDYVIHLDEKVPPNEITDPSGNLTF